MVTINLTEEEAKLLRLILNDDNLVAYPIIEADHIRLYELRLAVNNATQGVSI